MRMFRRITIALCLGLLLLSAPAYAFFSLTNAKNAMVDFLLEQLSTEGEFVITADEVKELDEGATAIVGLKIADANGVWFTAESLSFNWKPSRLLRGEVEFTSLVMSDISILRAPVEPPTVDIKEETGPPEEEGPFAWPRSPLTIRIDRMALERVKIAEAVLGHAISFDAEGSARDEGDIQAVSLDLKRTDDIEGVIEFAYSRNFSDNTLKVNLKAKEAAGGMVPHLAGLPEDAASAITLTADGPPTDWRAAFDVDLAETLAADGKATISYEGLLIVDATVNARPGPQLDPDIAALLGEQADLAAKITQQADGTFLVERGRIESPELKLTASGRFAPKAGASDLKLTLNAGGQLAEPIDGIDFSFVSFDGHITGPVGAVRAQGNLRLEGLRTAPVDVETAALVIDVRSSGASWARRTVLDVSGKTTGLRLDKIAPDVLGNAELAVKGSLFDQALNLETASLDSKVLKVKASGAGDLGATHFDLDFELSAPDLGPVVNAYGQQATGQIALAGQFRMRASDINLVAHTELRDFEHQMAAAKVLRLEGAVEVTGGTTRFDLSGKGQALRLDQLGPDVLGDPTLVVKGALTGDALTLETASLDSKVLSVKAGGTGDLDAPNFDMTFELTAPELANVARAYDVDARGAIDLSGTFQQRRKNITLTATTRLRDFAHPMAEARSLRLDGTVEVAGRTTRFDLKGRGDALRLDRIDAELLPQATLAAKGDLTDNKLTLQSFELDSPLVRAGVAGNVDLDTNAGRVVYEVGLPQLAVIAGRYDVALAGALTMRGTANLPETGAPRVEGNVGIENLTFDGTRYGQLAFSHDVEVSEAPAGKLGLRLRQSPYGDVRLDTGFAFAAPRLTLSGLSADALGLTATGDVVVRTDDMLADGALKLTIASLAPAGRLAGTPLAGSGWGTVQLSATGGQQNANVDLNVRSLSAAGARVAAAEVMARLRNVLGAPAIDVRARATGVATGDIELTTTTLTARGPLNGLSVNLETSGTLLDKSLLAGLDARVSAGGPTTTANVSRLDVTLAEDRIALTAPLRISASGGVTRLTGLDLSLPDQGRVTGDVTLAGRPVGGNLSVRLPSLAFVKRFADVPVKAGALDADTTFDGRGGQAVVKASGLVFEEVDAPGAIGIDARAEWAGRRLSVQASAEGGFGDPVRMIGTLPLARAGGLPDIARRGPIEARVAWKGEMGELWALVPVPGHVVSGKTTIDLGVGGDISNPQLSGGVELVDGTYQNLDIGTILTDLTLGTTLLGGGDLGLKLSASDGAKGKLTVDGRVALDASGIDLTTRIDHAVLVRRDDVIARLDGDIAIKGPATALDVTGKLLIEEAEVRLVNNSAPSIITLGDVRIKGAPPKKEREKAGRVDLDLTIQSNDRIFVRGRGLDSQWGADLRVTGTATVPIITGSVKKVRGRLDLLGKGFDLDRGEILFDGGKKIDPRVDVALIRKTADLTGGIVISGNASDPELAFTSTPSLPDDEVMPRILFGKSSQALTGSQAIQLSLGLATLMDGGGGTLDRVRSTVGLDQLRIDEDSEGNAALAIGKEVAEGVFVGTKQSLSGDGGTKVTVEIEVFDNVVIDTEIGSEGDASVGVQWKKDF